MIQRVLNRAMEGADCGTKLAPSLYRKLGLSGSDPVTVATVPDHKILTLRNAQSLSFVKKTVGVRQR